MAAITFATTAGNGTTLGPYNPALRTAAVQATTGQTDWFWVPKWAKVLIVYFNLSANAGTTPISIPSLLLAYPATLDDGDAAVLLTGASITAASFHAYEIGPTLTSAGTDSATADSNVVQNTVTPAVLGIKVLNDRTTADETYTYTLAAEVRG